MGNKRWVKIVVILVVFAMVGTFFAAAVSST